MARVPVRRAGHQAVGVQFDRVAAVCAALAVVGLAAFLLVRNEAIASPQLFFALRVVIPPYSRSPVRTGG